MHLVAADPLSSRSGTVFAGTGAGLGASHQSGWTGLIADVIRRRHGAVSSFGDIIRAIYQQAGR